MKFKLDECVDARLSINLEQAGYEAATVHQQGLRG
jgi:predicted nuclease of predicted toxin-antitoxin system